MGALDAFSGAFSLVAENKRVYLLVLVAMLILSIPSFSSHHSNRIIVRERMSPNVIFEEYGTTSTLTDALIRELKASLLEMLMNLIVLSLVGYSAVKAYLLSTGGEEYSLPELITEALLRIPAVIVVNILAYLTALLTAALPIGVIILGAVSSKAGIAFLGLFLLLATVPILLTYFALVVPAYVESKSIGAFVDALGLTIKNLPTSLGYGILVVLLTLGISILMTPLTLPLAKGGVNPALMALIEAPFETFIVCFLWAGGVLLYKDLKVRGREEEFLY